MRAAIFRGTLCRDCARPHTRYARARGTGSLPFRWIAITAAVVGVILNLSVWFALHVLFGQVEERHTGWLRWYAFDVSALDWKAAVLAVAAAVLAFVLHRGLVEIVAIMVALGVAARLLFGA